MAAKPIKHTVVHTLTEFKKEVLDAEVPVVVDFSARW
jgi:hypothetical protein